MEIRRRKTCDFCGRSDEAKAMPIGEVIDILEKIRKNDNTPPYEYDQPRKKDQKTPEKKGSRWLTPTEMCDVHLMDLHSKLKG